MIVSSVSGSLRLVTQPDHASFAGELLSLWRGGGLPDHPRRDRLIFAAREHDNGWWETDGAPRVDPESRRPCAFTELPDEPRRELWRRGARRFASQRPGAALLIVEHAVSIHSSRSGPEWAEFRAELGEIRSELLAEVTGGAEEGAAAWEAAEESLKADYPWLDLVDALSLAACGLPGAVRRHGHAALLEGAELRIDPFPLAGATTFRVPCRTIPDRDYAGDADLGGELATARWDEMAIRVTPW